jgi:hypothetical protein
VIGGRPATAGRRHKPAVIVVITAGWITPLIILWFLEPRTDSERSSLPVLLIPTVMRLTVMTESIVV